jgi:hypothetical protein
VNAEEVKNQSSSVKSAQYWYVPHTEIGAVTEKVTRWGFSNDPISSVSELLKMAWPVSHNERTTWHISTGVLTITTSLLIPLLASCKRGISRGKLIPVVKSVKHMLRVLDEVEDDASSEQSFVKYHNAILKQKLFRDSEPSPVRPACSKPLYNGWLKHYLALHLKRSHRLRADTLSLILSLYESKDKWPSPKGKVLEKAFLKHQGNVCNTEVLVSPERILRRIRSVSRQVLGKNCPMYGNKYLPSGAGCIQAARTQGGTGSLIKNGFKLKLDDFAVPSIETDNLTRVLKTRPERTIFPHVEEWKQTEYEHAVTKVTEKFLSHDEHLFDTKVVAIPEPSKYRIISLMDGYLSNALQPAQGQLIVAWKKFPGNTMTHTVEELVTKMILETAHEPDMKKLVSGDFEGATDSLHKDASDASLDAVLPFICDPNIAALSFLPSTIRYPVYKDGIRQTELEKGKVVYSEAKYLQTGGQLMGHRLSFPLLCIINFACFVHAIIEWSNSEKSQLFESSLGGRRVVSLRSKSRREKSALSHSMHLLNRDLLISEREYPEETAAYLKVDRIAALLKKTVIINGDDILFKCPETFYPHWCAAVAAVGFKLSIGKNYVSEDVMQANSQVFSVSSNNVIKRHNYLNQKLIFGDNPDTSALEKDLMWDSITGAYRVMTPMALARELNFVFKSCPIGRDLIPYSLKRWSPDLTRTESGYTPNWYLPAALGGLGLLPQWADDRRIRYTREQRKVASFFKDQPGQSLYRIMGKPKGKSIKSLELMCQGRMAKRWDMTPISEGPEVLHLGQTEDNWMLRITLIDEMTKVGFRKDSDSVTLSKKKVWYGEKAQAYDPIPLAEIAPYHRVAFTCGALPPCVPLKSIVPMFHLKPSKRRAVHLDPSSVDMSVAGMARRWSCL